MCVCVCVFFLSLEHFFHVLWFSEDLFSSLDISLYDRSIYHFWHPHPKDEISHILKNISMVLASCSSCLSNKSLVSNSTGFERRPNGCVGGGCVCVWGGGGYNSGVVYQD